jgi:hypothetical protein
MQSSEPLQTTAEVLSNSIKQPGFKARLAVGLLPFSPVQFTGPDSLIAWGRLLGYSALAYYTFNKMRPLSYIAMSCAGLSLASSLTAGMFNKSKQETEQ